MYRVSWKAPSYSHKGETGKPVAATPAIGVKYCKRVIRSNVDVVCKDITMTKVNIAKPLWIV